MEKQKIKDKQPDNKAAQEMIKEKDKQIEEYERRITKMEFDAMLDGELSKSKARNKTAVKALLNMDKISVHEGSLIGVSEQINSIKQRDGYLFEGVDTGGGANPSGVKEHVDLDALSDREYFRVKFGK